MRKRTKSREYALQLLYQADIRRDDCRECQDLEEFWQMHEPVGDVKTFANQLALGTIAHLAEIDPLITAHAEHWELKRMAVIDRNILRLGVFELRYQDDVPPKVCISEAVELAKRFGEAESSKFINGILDAILKAHPRKGTPPPRASDARLPQ